MVENGVPRVFDARTKRRDGGSATLSVTETFSGASIRSVTTVGRERLTNAEDEREDIMLGALQGKFLVDENPFIQSIWLLKRKATWSGCRVAPTSPMFYFPSKRNLNNSQREAVNAILSNTSAHRVVLIQGPLELARPQSLPLVSSVSWLRRQTTTMWLVAQSNVAVKNIAEKLATENFFDFKVLVSKDVHFDWYVYFSRWLTVCIENFPPFQAWTYLWKNSRNLIRSDDFVDDVVATERQLLGSRVLLCTISMLPNMKLGTFSRLVPPQTVIFDEASQIEIGDYFPMLTRFRSTLRKLVFIGDDKQCGSYNLLLTLVINLFSGGTIRS